MPAELPNCCITSHGAVRSPPNQRSPGRDLNKHFLVENTSRDSRTPCPKLLSPNCSYAARSSAAWQQTRSLSGLISPKVVATRVPGKLVGTSPCPKKKGLPLSLPRLHRPPLGHAHSLLA